MVVTPTRRARVLLVEPFLDGSHRAWAEGYRENSRHDVRILGQPAGPWRWKIQASAPTLGAEAVGMTRRWRPDAVIVSSMTDVAQFIGIARRALGPAPVIAYRHESQLLYPQVPGERLPVGIALGEWASLMAADRVVFNSEFHRRSVLDEWPRFFDAHDDEDAASLLPGLAARTLVLPVGIDLGSISPENRTSSDGPPIVAFNHRWHHDKNPTVFLDLLAQIADEGVEFRLIMCGDDDLPDTGPIHRRLTRLGERVLSAGRLSRPDYLDALHRADVVVSTASQEFFGIAVVEAVAAGAVPVLPDDLSYPDVIPGRHHDAVLTPRPELAARLAATLTDLSGVRARVAGLAEAMRAYDWTTVAPAYDALVDAEIERVESATR